MEQAEGVNTPGSASTSPIEVPQEQAPKEPIFASISGDNDDVAVTDAGATNLARAKNELATTGGAEGLSEAEENAARVKRAATDAAKLAAASIQDLEDEHKSDLDAKPAPQPG